MLGIDQKFTVAILLVITVGLSASCSSKSASSKSAGPASASETSASAGSLSLSMPVVAPLEAELFLAKQLGYFDKYHVAVDLKNEGALGVSKMVAGQVDIAQNSPTAAFGPQANGRSLSVIYSFLGNLGTGLVVGKNSSIHKLATTADTVMQLAGKKLVTQGTNGSNYGSAVVVSKYIVDHGGAKPTIVSVQDTAAAVAQLSSGQVDAGIESPDIFAPAIEAGQVKLLISNNNKTMMDIIGGGATTITLFGRSELLKSKASAVAALLAGIMDAHAYVISHSIDEVASLLKSNDAFSGQSLDSIKTSVQYDLPFFSPNAGYISEAVWKDGLRVMANWGSGQDVTKPIFSYGSLVDMSYLNAAKKLRR